MRDGGPQEKTSAEVSGITIRRFEDRDAAPVRALFIGVNRQLAPPGDRDAFEAYITRCLADEIDRIAEYYHERRGGFWVALRDDRLVGMFGLERVVPNPRPASDAMELRRMYVDPAFRRDGIGRLMLQFAEAECRRAGVRRLELSTSELQPAALELYRRAGYHQVREEVAGQISHKTVGGGIRRYYFEKDIRCGASPGVHEITGQ